MLMFLATLGTSVAATFVVELLDIECIRQTGRRLQLRLGEGKKAEASFAGQAAFSGLR